MDPCASWQVRTRENTEPSRWAANNPGKSEATSRLQCCSFSPFTEPDNRLHKCGFLFKHGQVATVRNEFDLGMRNVLPIGLAISGRHQSVFVSPDQQNRTANPMQAASELRIIRPFPHQSGEDGKGL